AGVSATIYNPITGQDTFCEHASFWDGCNVLTKGHLIFGPVATLPFTPRNSWCRVGAQCWFSVNAFWLFTVFVFDTVNHPLFVNFDSCRESQTVVFNFTAQGHTGWMFHTFLIRGPVVRSFCDTDTHVRVFIVRVDICWHVPGQLNI